MVEKAFIKLYLMDCQERSHCGINLSTCVYASEVTFVPVSKVNGRAEAEDILAAVRPSTCLVIVMLANNETGVIMVSHLTFLKTIWGAEKGPRFWRPHASPLGPLVFSSICNFHCPQ